MSTVEVIRRRPPEVQRCKGKGCGRLVEWVLTAVNGRRMPVTHPLCALREVGHDDGDVRTVIDGATVHFNTCPAASTFRRRPAAPRTPKPVQQRDLFRDGGDR
jgi:hypothetical protein